MVRLMGRESPAQADARRAEDERKALEFKAAEADGVSFVGLVFSLVVLLLLLFASAVVTLTRGLSCAVLKCRGTHNARLWVQPEWPAERPFDCTSDSYDMHGCPQRRRGAWRLWRVWRRRG